MIKLRYNTIGERNVMDYAEKSKESYSMKKMENDKKQTIMILEDDEDLAKGSACL